MPDPSRPLRWQRAVITGITPQTQRVRSYQLEPAAPFAFRAGQHVDIRLTAPDGYQARRSYSIASPPESPQQIELTVERLDDGEVSPFFHDVVQVGDDIELRGPIGGHFVWSTEDEGPVLLVGGGSGIVPLMCMVRHRAARAATVPMLLLASFRMWDEVIYRGELRALHRQRSGFELVTALTRDADRQEADYHRRVDEAMAAEVLERLPAAPRQVYVCGSNPFVEAAAQSFIASGVTADIIRTERFGG